MIDLNSINVYNSSGGTLRITLADDDFSFPLRAGHTINAFGKAGGVLSGPAGSSVSFQCWVNTANAMPLPGVPTTIPAGSTPMFVPGPSTSGPGAFAFSDTADFLLGASSFSLFSQAVINFTGSGAVGFNQELSAVPEPTALVLFGSGLLSLAGVARRRRRKP